MKNSLFDHSGAEKGEWPLFSLFPISQVCTSNTVHPFSQPGMPFRENSRALQEAADAYS